MSGHRRSATRKRRSGCCGNLSQHIVENATYVYHHDAGTRVSRHHKMRERGNPFIDGTYAAGQHHKQVGKSYHACFALGKVGSRDKRIDKPVGTMRKTLRHHTRYVRPRIMSLAAKMRGRFFVEPGVDRSSSENEGRRGGQAPSLPVRRLLRAAPPPSGW